MPSLSAIDAYSQAPELRLSRHARSEHRPVADLNPRQSGVYGIEKRRPIIRQKRLRHVYDHGNLAIRERWLLLESHLSRFRISVSRTHGFHHRRRGGGGRSFLLIQFPYAMK
jgi:hypothetical protein